MKELEYSLHTKILNMKFSLAFSAAFIALISFVEGAPSGVGHYILSGRNILTAMSDQTRKRAQCRSRIRQRTRWSLLGSGSQGLYPILYSIERCTKLTFVFQSSLGPRLALIKKKETARITLVCGFARQRFAISMLREYQCALTSRIFLQGIKA